jgi:glycosyltransferase involved in cell wall biosynthesis
MARIAIADDGIVFDGTTPEQGPLGGAESAVIGLAEALAARGHHVSVHNRTPAPRAHNGVEWQPLEAGLPERPDLYIANRGDKLIPLAPGARARSFWIHNPAGYLLKWRYLSKLARWRPTIVFSGASHASTYPRWAPGRRAIIPYGVADTFRGSSPRPAPPPRAIFTSSPLRSLDWLLDLWSAEIRPRVPAAELHIFSGPATYGALGAAKAGKMLPVIERAAGMSDAGVVLRPPVAKAALAAELARMRLYLYRGDVGETFCLSAAEAQAMGLPGVVENIACMRERIRDGRTGFVVEGAEAFVAASVRLLTDDALWLAQHRNALSEQGGYGWNEAAAGFEQLLA